MVSVDLFHFGVERHQDEDVDFLIGLSRPSEDRGDCHSRRVSRKHGCLGQAHAAKGYTNLRPEARVFDLSDRFLPTFRFLIFKANQPKISHLNQLVA